MQKKLLLTILAFISLHLHSISQKLSPADSVFIAKIQTYPTRYSNTKGLIKQINEDFSKPEDKAKAAYTWIALNVVYDVDLYRNKGRKPGFYRLAKKGLSGYMKYQDKLANHTISKGKGVCDGYSTLYKKVCMGLGVTCVRIVGLSKTQMSDIGKHNRKSDHAWNAIKLNGRWQLVDVTWGAGVVVKNRYFHKDFNYEHYQTPKDKFALKHYPDELEWLGDDLTKKEFIDGPLYHRGMMYSDIEFIAPAHGIITVSPQDSVINFRIKSGDGKPYLSYAFGDKYSNDDIDFVKQGDFFVFSIPLPKRRDDNLHIYNGKEAIVTYLIKTER